MNESGAISDILCPLCKTRTLETAGTVRSVRGQILAFKVSTWDVIGCAKCVSGELRKEAGRGALYGWLSPVAAVLTVIFVPWNLIAAGKVAPDREKVASALRKLGVADTQALTEIRTMIYAVIVAMIKADGRVDQNELHAVAALGPQIMGEFDMNRVHELLSSSQQMVGVEPMIRSVAPFLKDDGKTALLRALLFVAYADGSMDQSEAQLVERVRDALGIPKSTLTALQSEVEQSLPQAAA